MKKKYLATVTIVALAAVLGATQGNAKAQISDYDRQGMHDLMQWNRAAQQGPRLDLMDQLEKEVPKGLRSKRALRRLPVRTIAAGTRWAVSPGKLDDSLQGLTGFGMSGTFAVAVHGKVIKHVRSHQGYDMVLVRLSDEKAGDLNGKLFFSLADDVQ